MAGSGPWVVERHREAPSAFHARSLPDPLVPTVWVCDADRPALVLGSAQRDDVVDRAACRAAGIEVVRRRSGGGAVLVVPGDLVWVDVLLPAEDPRWDPDVGRAFHWLGAVWASLLDELGVAASVHRGGLAQTPWGRLVCFAGLGPGEVTIGAGVDPPAPKVVGISQRRTRAGARFQCAALVRWDPGALTALLDLEGGDRAALVETLTPLAAGLPLEPEVLLDGFLRHLART